MPVTIINRRGPLRICVSYFVHPKEEPLCDIHRVRSLLSPMEDGTWTCTRDNTLCIDLRPDLDAIMKQMGESTRYKVRRAGNRDGLEVKCFPRPTAESLDRFKSLHSGFLAAKALEEPDYGMIEKLNAQGALSVSFVTHPELGEVAFHAHIFDQDRARLLWSGHIPLPEKSEHNSLVGRGNRLLHWADFGCFKELGLGCYDFGGIYLKDDDERLAGITKFKLGFGGQVVPEYHCVKGLTLSGRLALLVKKMRERKPRSAQVFEKVATLGGLLPWISTGSELL